MSRANRSRTLKPKCGCTSRGSEARNPLNQGCAFRSSKERRLLHICCIHNCPQIVHTLVEPWEVGDTIGHTGPALVKHCNPSKGCQPQQPSSDCGVLPVNLNVRYKIWSKNQIDRPIAED